MTSDAMISSQVIRVLSLPGMTTVLERLAPRFERTTGHSIIASFDVNVPMTRRIEGGEMFDVVVTTTTDLAHLMTRKRLLANIRIDLAMVGIGIWIRTGAPRPDISTPDALVKLLRDAASISYTKESAAGQHIAGLIERLGLGQEMKPKTMLLGGGGQNPRAVAAGRVQYGFSIVADGIGVPGVELLGLLPEDVQKWIVFSGGIAIDAAASGAARGLLDFLRSKENTAVFEAHGWHRP
jgi:molybdate transport system substrate-binding protein